MSIRLAASTYGDGEGAGFLRIIPQGEPLVAWSPRDVIVVENAPLDLSVVAALLSAGPQSGASHLSLRLKEKKVPNASVPAIYQSEELRAWQGRLVHVRVGERTTGGGAGSGTGTGSAGSTFGGVVEIRLTTLAEAEQLWARQRPVVGALALDLARRDWPSFAELRHADAPAFGAKTANLGELHRVLPALNRVEGFGLPASVYEDFISSAGLTAEVEALLVDRRLVSDPAWRRQALQQLRRRIETAPLPAGLLAQITERVTAVLGAHALNERLRFRSSTNAEDLEAFSGAGLYESRSGCLADDLDGDAAGPSGCVDATLAQHFEAELAMWRERKAREPDLVWIDEIIRDLEGELRDEKSAAMALKKVWASLWNDRAFDERDYYGLDHRRVKMAVAVLPAEKQEQVQAVAFTNVRYQMGRPFFAMVSQRGEIGVVRPVDPTAQAELRLFWRGPGDQVIDDVLLSASSLVAQGASLWSAEKLQVAGRLLFMVQDHFQANVYADRPSLALDIELRVTREGHVVLKQARPYTSELPPF
jgi:pyruvate,water dikinase